MRVLLAAVIAGLWESFRETLPDSEETAGAFRSGLIAGFAVNLALLVYVTVAARISHGGW